MTVIKGTAKNDSKRGTSSDDSIFGFAGDDIIFGSDANDFIDGGDGNDKVVFRGNRDAYTVERQGENEELSAAVEEAQRNLDEKLAIFDEAQIAFTNAQTMLDEAQAALDNAQSVVDGTEKPTTKELSALEDAQELFDEIVAMLDELSNSFDLDTLQADVEEAQTALDDAQAAIEEAGSIGETIIVTGTNLTSTLVSIENIQFNDGTFTVEELTAEEPTPPEAPVIDKITDDNVIEPSELESGVTISGTAEVATMITLSSGDFNVEVETSEDGTWSYDIDSSYYDSFSLNDSGYVSIEAVAVNSQGDSSEATSIDVLVISPTHWTVGDDAKNTLVGKNIYGGEGNDTLKGNTEDGMLIGGAGKDLISGGTGNDHFIFLDESDSGILKTDRDVIKDFKSGKDLIDLSHFIKGDVSGLVFIGTDNFDNSQFPAESENTTAQVRFSKGILSVDSDADNKADFSVELTGVKVLAETDLILS